MFAVVRSKLDYIVYLNDLNDARVNLLMKACLEKTMIEQMGKRSHNFAIHISYILNGQCIHGAFEYMCLADYILYPIESTGIMNINY